MKIAKLISVVIAVCLSYVAGVLITESKSTLINNNDVRVEYIKCDNGDYDLLIDGKNKTNMTSEINVNSDGWYKSWYLVGSTKEKNNEFREKNNIKEPLIWED